MRCHWFSPLPPAKSGIADYAAQVLPAMAKHGSITCWTDQMKWDAGLEHFVRINHYDPARPPWVEFNRAEMNIYHIGNQADFHGAIWEIASRCPGLIILHDAALHHLFGAIYRDRRRSRSEYLSVVRRHHGEDALPAAEAFFSERLDTEHMAEHYPLTWHALDNALGVVVHSSHVFDQLDSAKRLPVAYVPLAYAINHEKASPRRTDDGLVHLVVMGFLSRNRRLEQIVDAIAEFPRRANLHLHICGELEQPEVFAENIRARQLDSLVTLHGYMPDQQLDELLAKCDLALNLRYPSMGEASLTQLRLWAHALPTLVTRVGWYATLPPDAVCFVRPEHELTDIRRHLDAFIDHPERLRQMGLNGRAYFESEHSPEAYAKAVVEFGRAIAGSTLGATDYLARRVGAVLGRWAKYTDGDARALTHGAARQILAITGS